MLELNMNGKGLSDNDIAVLISRNSILNITDVQFFTDDGEVALDDTNAAIDIKINIICNENVRQKVDENKRKSTIDKVKHSLRCAYQMMDDLD